MVGGTGEPDSSGSGAGAVVTFHLLLDWKCKLLTPV